MLLSLGTPMNMAAFPLQDSKNIANVSPLSAARQMDEPFNTLHFAGTASYYDQIVSGVKYLQETNGRTKVCPLFIPTDFGKEVQLGSQTAAEETEGLEYGVEATAKPDTADFVGSLTKLKEAGCDVVTMALGVRQAITAYATARKIGWGPEQVDFINASAGFHTAIAQVPGGITNGLYAAAGWTDLGARMDDPEVKKFADEYIKVSGESAPGTGAVLGYSAATTLVNALESCRQGAHDRQLHQRHGKPELSRPRSPTTRSTTARKSARAPTRSSSRRSRKASGRSSSAIEGK